MKIVVTGIGAHCALGENIETLWQAIEQGNNGIAPINRFNVDEFDTDLGAMVSSGNRFVTEDQRLLAYGHAAATEALQHAKISNRDRVALVLGTCNGLQGSEIDVVSSKLINFLDLGGLAITFSTACASSTHAIGFAADLVRRGIADFVLTGGVDTLSIEIFAGFHCLGLLSKSPCAPFSTNTGTTLGEGAAFMVLESESSANARKIEPLAAFMGYGLSADAYHDTTPIPSGSGMAQALSAAIIDAGITPNSISYLNAHGTGTTANDAAEWSAVQHVFGNGATKLPISSSKSFLGHAQGAAGALEAVVTMIAMQHKVITPTMNFTEPRPNAPSDPVADTKPRPYPIQYAVSTNAAFGGFNAALIFGEKENPLQSRREKPRFIRICSTGKVQDYHKIKQFVPNSELRSIDKSARLLGGAVAIALTNAEIRLQSPDCENIGLFVGQTRISQESVEAFSDSVEARGLLSFSATAFTRMACSYATGVSCRLFGLKGPSTTLSTGADSGLTALVIGADHLAWRDDVNSLLTAAVDEPNKLDDYENGAASILLTAGAEPASIHLTGWAIATDCEAAIIQALTNASLNPEDVVKMDAQGPPTVAGLWAVIDAIDALKSGETGPFLISSKEQGSAGAAVILQNGVKNAI